MTVKVTATIWRWWKACGSL